jgi:hypothetical protein
VPMIRTSCSSLTFHLFFNEENIWELLNFFVWDDFLPLLQQSGAKVVKNNQSRCILGQSLKEFDHIYPFVTNSFRPCKNYF